MDFPHKAIIVRQAGVTCLDAIVKELVLAPLSKYAEADAKLSCARAAKVRSLH